MAAYDPVSITVELSNPEKYAMFLQFCEENDIHIMHPLSKISFDPVFLDRKLRRKPNLAFKTFCRSENLTKDGTITEEEVYKVVMRHVSVFDLWMPNGSIRFDTKLQEAFETDRVYFFEHEIARLASSVLQV